jgi:hypothetical protein
MTATEETRDCGISPTNNVVVTTTNARRVSGFNSSLVTCHSSLLKLLNKCF